MVFAAIGMAVSAAVSAISTAVSTIGPAVATFCTTVLPRIAPFIDKGIEILRVAGAIVQTVLQVAGVFGANERIDEMGDRALQASEQGIVPEQFDSFDEYLDRIREIPLDPEKSAKTSEYEKIGAGLAIGATALDRHFKVADGVMENLVVMAFAKPGFFNGERLSAILGKTTDITSIMNYFDGKLDFKSAVAVEKTLADVERTLSPGKSDEAIARDLNEAKAAMRNPPA